MSLLVSLSILDRVLQLTGPHSAGQAHRAYPSTPGLDRDNTPACTELGFHLTNTNKSYVAVILWEQPFRPLQPSIMARGRPACPM